jgi:hypothetical protein
MLASNMGARNAREQLLAGKDNYVRQRADRMQIRALTIRTDDSRHHTQARGMFRASFSRNKIWPRGTNSISVAAA